MGERIKSSASKNKSVNCFDAMEHLYVSDTEKVIKSWTVGGQDGKGDVIRRTDIIVTDRRLVTVSSYPENITRTSYNINDIRGVKYSIENNKTSLLLSILLIIIGILGIVGSLFSLIMFQSVQVDVNSGVYNNVELPWGSAIIGIIIGVAILAIGVQILRTNKDKHSVAIYIYLNPVSRVSLNEVGIAPMNKNATMDRLVIHNNDCEIIPTVFHMITDLDNIISDVQSLYRDTKKNTK